jgi:hypothetical protein
MYVTTTTTCCGLTRIGRKISNGYQADPAVIFMKHVVPISHPSLAEIARTDVPVGFPAGSADMYGGTVF